MNNSIISKKSLAIAALAATSMFAISDIAQACSNFNFNANGNTFVGRTMEWPGELNAQVALVPQQHQFSYGTSKYGFVGIMHQDELFSSGLNEHGLNGEALVLGESQFAPEGQEQLKSGDLVGFVLSNAKNVDEAEALLKQHKVSIAAYDVVDGLHLATHFAFNDGKRAIVVEYQDGSGYPTIFENKLGVMTNDPSYQTQQSLAAMLVDGGKTQFSEETFAAFDMSPIGRFQKLTALHQTQDLQLVKSDFDAVNRAWNMINSVDIPQGALYWRFASDLPQFTSFANVVDINNKDYYFRTYDNMDVRKIDLNSINFKQAKFISKSIFKTGDYQEYSFK
ncbi:linear amide C-N hydrolase [Shewanella maritima]|uniref:Linear amide C-N hydrolase n=1 Tax=Shewanella maritima TaxID=2520507 RepID=A0A411PI61_9GAMM|nr:linear amide C-N hydrolase [Shewanella maritima]QBF83040.1 linear amide C-N hydrolase [Shewanella maritima]